MSSAELSRREEALSRSPLFGGLPKRHRRALSRVTGISTYDEGTTVVAEGGPGTSFFVILDGVARVVQGRRTLARLEAGNFFGEISLLDGGPRMATVVAEGPITCLTLAREDFQKVVGQEPKVLATIVRELARRLRAVETAVG